MRTCVRDLAGEQVQPVPTSSRPAEPAGRLVVGGGATEGGADALSLLLLALDQQPWRFQTARPGELAAADESYSAAQAGLAELLDSHGVLGDNDAPERGT